MWPTSLSPWHCTSPRDTGLLQDGANNSCNYILDDLINGLAKESDNNEDGENVIDKGKAKNYSDGSNDSGDTDDNDFGDGNSSGNNKDNEARRYIRRQELPTPINS